jgi:hypothetical protein
MSHTPLIIAFCLLCILIIVFMVVLSAITV